MALGTKVSADRIFRRRPAQIWSWWSFGLAPAGLMGAVKAMLFVDMVIWSIFEVIEVGCVTVIYARKVVSRNDVVIRDRRARSDKVRILTIVPWLGLS